jgi:hypothetical protein
MHARLAAALLLSLTACGPSAAQVRRSTVQKRSAIEWNCAKEDVTVRYLGGGVYEARGCGERATYVCDNIQSMGPYGPMPGRGRTRCVLESRDGYARDGDPPPPPPQQRSSSMPGWQ